MSPTEISVDDKSTIDNNTTSSVENSTGDTPVQEAEADPAQDSQSGETDGGTSTGEEGSDAPPEAGADGNRPSLTPPTPSKTKPIPWQKRFQDMEPHLTRTQQELKRVQNQLRGFDGIDANAIRQWQAQQQHAQRANLPVWNPQHPENSGFKSLQTRWQFANQALTKAQGSPAFDEMRSQLLSQFSPSEQQQMQHWHQHQQAEVARLASDPEAQREMYRKEAQAVVRAELQQAQQEQQQRAQAEQHVDTWFKNPSNKAVIANFGQAMAHALQQGVPWHIVQRDAENAYLRSQLGTGKQTVAAAEEQRRLAKGNASITRDPATRPMADLFEEAKKLAKERGVRPGTPQFMPILHEVEARHRADATTET